MSAKTGFKLGPNKLNISSEAIAGGGAASVAGKAIWPVQDAMHVVHTADAVQTGSIAHHVTATTAASSAGGIFGSLGHSLVSSVGGFLSIAAGTGISAYFNHLVHGHHEKEMLDRYRPQFASVLGKEEDAVKVDDMYAIAQHNPSLDAELDRNKGMRNLRTTATLVATTVAFATVFASMMLFPPLAALGAAAATAGLFSGASAGFLAATTAISFATLHAVGGSVTKIGKKLMGYNVPNVEDHIHGLDDHYKDGEHVSPELVFGVFVAASPEMQATIKKQFGKRYEKLSGEQQKQAEAMLADHLPLEEYAAAINSGQMNPRELLFTVHGQASGIVHPGAAREHALNEAADQSQELARAQAQQPEMAQAPQVQQAPQAPQQQAAPQATPDEETRNQNWREIVEKQRAQQPSPEQAR